jgi:hypothetical protein
MSVINDALKKAGQKSDLLPGAPKRKTRFNWGPLFVIGILLLITTPLLGPLFHQPYLNQSTAQQQSVGVAMPSETSNMKAQYAVEEMPLLVPAKAFGVPAGRTPNFSLNGLVFSPDGSYCLINGKVVKTGETVGGATLEQVTPNEAVLDFKGNKIVLTANL